MITTLHIKNIGIIDEININLKIYLIKTFERIFDDENFIWNRK